MEIKKWNEIQHSFTTKFGWYDGLRHMMDISKDFTKGKRSSMVFFIEGGKFR